MSCPCCGTRELIATLDAETHFTSWVCPACQYYDSNSDAFKLYPSIFNNLGERILNELNRELSEYGLTVDQAQAWAENEPAFTKRNFTPLDAKRRLYRTL